MESPVGYPWRIIFNNRNAFLRSPNLKGLASKPLERSAATWPMRWVLPRIISNCLRVELVLTPWKRLPNLQSSAKIPR